MIEIGKTLISDDVVSEQFVCDLTKCKGACCVEGDLGAPLNEDELEKIEEVIDLVKPYLTPEAIEVLEQEVGTYWMRTEICPLQRLMEKSVRLLSMIRQEF